VPSRVHEEGYVQGEGEGHPVPGGSMRQPANVRAVRAVKARLRRIVKATKRQKRAVAARQGAMIREYRKGRVEDDKLYRKGLAEDDKLFHRQLLEDERRFNLHLLALMRGPRL